jgi:hypothetical protein
MSQEMIQGYRLSPQQRRLWELGLSDRSAVCEVRINGELDLTALREAIRQVVARHEILRTTFKLLPGMTLPVQVISDSPDNRTFHVDLIPRATNEHTLIISLPALCADAHSLQCLVSQIADAFAGQSRDLEVLQYADFAEWKHELLEEESAGRRYWQQHDLTALDSQKLSL